MAKIKDELLDEKHKREVFNQRELEHLEKDYVSEAEWNRLVFEKRLAEADDRERDIANGWEPYYDRDRDSTTQ